MTWRCSECNIHNNDKLNRCRNCHKKRWRVEQKQYEPGEKK